MQNNKQPRSISQILNKVAATSDNYEVIELTKGVMIEVRRFEHKSLGVIPKFKLVTAGFELEFGYSPKKWENSNGFENEDFVKKVMAAFPELFKVVKPTNL